MEVFSAMDEMRLIAARDRVENGKFHERTKLMGEVQQLAEAIDQRIADTYGISESIFQTMADISYSLQERGITERTPLNDEYNKVVDRLVSTSPLASYPHGFMVSPEGLETCIPIQLSDGHFFFISIGKNLTLYEDITRKDQPARSTQLTIPGDHFNYDTEKISLMTQTTNPDGHFDRYTMYMFPRGIDGYSKQKTVKRDNTIKYPLTTYPFDPNIYAATQQTIQGFKHAALKNIPRIKIPTRQF